MRWKPHRVEAFARWYGLRVSYEKLAPGCRGFFPPFSRDIAVNQDDHPLEQQFTIAHELAHFELHYRRAHLFSHLSREMEADFSACGLLFAAKRFDALRYHLVRHPLSIFAALFGIPITALTFYILRRVLHHRRNLRRTRTLNPA